jgi:aromatic-amino-acid transaminase
MADFNMVTDRAIRPGGKDPIFAIAGQAAERAEEIGSENVINSTIGALLDDDGKLITFESIYDYFKGLPNEEIAAYSALPGMPNYLVAVKEACFKEHVPEGYIEAIATPGGSGAIRHAMCNYTNYNDEILIADWHWSPYNTLAAENDRKIAHFELFTDEGVFNHIAYENKVNELLDKQGRLLVILNTPAHNPTGYTVTDQEWDRIVEFLNEIGKNRPEDKLILMVDVAYIDFSGKDSSVRSFMTKLTGLPRNVLVLYAYSASKGFTMYGLRNGAILCVTDYKEIADEFRNACAFSNRGTWSNGTRSAMVTIAHVFEKPELREKVMIEQAGYKELLQKRAEAFVASAKDAGLEIAPYKDGFFITIPCDNPKVASDKLIEKDAFLVPLNQGLRFAVCAVSEEKCKKAPYIIKEVLDSM